MADYFDIYPLAFLKGVEQHMTVQAFGYRKQVWKTGEIYSVRVCEAAIAEERRFPGSGSTVTVDAVVGEDGCLHFDHTFPREGLYLIDLDEYFTLEVYALGEDMKGRYPYRGDLHMHTNRSDGREPPQIVAANYRGHGYDFTVISDHYRYFPSLEARKFYKFDDKDESELTDLLIVPGEEVHLPWNDVHYINFGGAFSINHLVKRPIDGDELDDNDEINKIPAWLKGEVPARMSAEDFEAMIRERAQSVPREIESERLSFAVMEWVYGMVQKAGGLGIFPHPYWRCKTMQLSEDYIYFVYKKRPFDAYEVLGGENYYEHNGFQTQMYYELKGQGYDCPVVGSTDSHSSYKTNRNALVCSTIVFAGENKTQALIDSIKGKYSVAVDSISTEYRLVGDFRWVKYAAFLMKNWYPIHDRICSAEGVYMREYANGSESAETVLRTVKGTMPSMFVKYFNV